MKRIAVFLALALCLAGCASDGPLSNGEWFLPYHSHEGPHLWLGRTILNAGLFALYVTAGVAYLAAEACVQSACCRPCR